MTMIGGETGLARRPAALAPDVDQWHTMTRTARSPRLGQRISELSNRGSSRPALRTLLASYGPKVAAE